jgi:hypothetical protein
MISIKDTIINDIGISESPKNDINKILFRDINYCHKKLEDGFISRDVNYYQSNNEDNNNVFYKIMNDCVVIPKYEKDKYKELILEKKESSDESADEESLDQLIINIEKDIAGLDKKIGNVLKQTYILSFSLPKEYEPAENDPEFKVLKDQTIKIIDEGINKKFKYFYKTDL